MADPAVSAAVILAQWREAEQKATPGPWHLEWDSCDCGDGYGCSHGSWPHAIHNSRAHTERPDGVQHDYDFAHSDIAELSGDDAEFIIAARTAMPLLLGAVERVLELHQPGRIRVFGYTCEHHEAHRFFSITATEAQAVRDCPACKATVYHSCTGCGTGVSVDACPVREAITAALTGAQPAGPPQSGEDRRAAAEALEGLRTRLAGKGDGDGE
jgi:hypothetical protein